MFIVLSEERFNEILERLDQLASPSNTNASDPLSEFISNEELAKKLNLSTRTLQRYRDQELIRFYQLSGRRIYYKISDVLNFMNEHRVEPFDSKKKIE